MKSLTFIVTPETPRIASEGSDSEQNELLTCKKENAHLKKENERLEAQITVLTELVAELTESMKQSTEATVR